MSAHRARAIRVLLAALAVGVAVWAVGRLWPGVDGALARHGGVVVPLYFEREVAVETALRIQAKRLGEGVRVARVGQGEGWALSMPRSTDPGPGYLPPRPVDDGGALFRPTPDRAERWRKRAFNALVERLDARLESLPRGRGQVAMPGAGSVQLELTHDAALDWLPAVLSPGRLSVWRGGVAVADHLDVVRAALDGDAVKVGLRDGAHPGSGAIELRLDGDPIARGAVATDGILSVPVLPELAPGVRDRVRMLLVHGDLPLPVRAGEARRLAGAR